MAHHGPRLRTRVDQREVVRSSVLDADTSTVGDHDLTTAKDRMLSAKI